MIIEYLHVYCSDQNVIKFKYEKDLHSLCYLDIAISLECGCRRTRCEGIGGGVDRGRCLPSRLTIPVRSDVAVLAFVVSVIGYQ